MNDPNSTMEEYIRLEEEKARRRAIVFNEALTSEVTLFCEPTIPADLKIDFKTSFDESDDEDYTVIYDENSFSYKIISVNNLKTDSENDNDKVNMPSFPSPKPEVSYSNDLDFFKDFENEFPAIVYNDALTSKLDFLTEPTISPQHIDEFNLKDETSLSECDEEEQNVLYFNDLFPFNVIYPDDLKSNTDNGNDEIDIEQPSGDMSIVSLPNVINVNAQGSNKLLETSHDTSTKFFKTKTFIKKLNVNIMTCNLLNNGMLLNLIKNLYVPFGIPFDPKLFYKDGIKLEKVELNDWLKQKCFPRDNPVVFKLFELFVCCTSLSSQTLHTAYRTPLDTAYGCVWTLSDLAIRKSTIWYTLKKTCVELVRAF
ncbi:hypothetical protein Tco_0996695 [Tanacetum coccineum]